MQVTSEGNDFSFIDEIDENYVYRASTYMLMFSRSLRDQCFPLKTQTTGKSHGKLYDQLLRVSCKYRGRMLNSYWKRELKHSSSDNQAKISN